MGPLAEHNWQTGIRCEGRRRAAEGCIGSKEANLIEESAKRSTSGGVTRWGGLPLVRVRDVKGPGGWGRSLPEFLPVRETHRWELVLNQAVTPKDNCFDRKSGGECSIQTGNCPKFSETQRKGTKGAGNPFPYALCQVIC